MNPRKLAVLAGTGAILAAGSFVASANAAPGGSVARYQLTSTSYTVSVLNQFEHDYTLTTSPCDGSVTITGGTPVDSGYYTTETISGGVTGDTITLVSTYDGPYNPGYSYLASFPVAGGALSGDYTGTVTNNGSTSTNYANHGQYVSSQGGGSDAAHSCIGMPISK